jgi:uncharacterized membrane protein YcaP (DUF421 family)
MYELLDAVLGLSLKSEQLDFGHMAARALVMYVALIALVRSGKKRFLGNATAIDFILTVMIGAIAARAVTGGAPFFPSLVALGAFVLAHWLFSAAARGSPAFSVLIKGHSTVLVKDGRIDEKALRNEHMSQGDLEEDLREKGMKEVSGVAEARLERSGRLSVIKRD